MKSSENKQPQGRVLRLFLTFMFYSDTEIIPDVLLHVLFDGFLDFPPDFSHAAVLLARLRIPHCPNIKSPSPKFSSP
jgi:hypothetical protein